MIRKSQQIRDPRYKGWSKFSAQYKGAEIHFMRIYKGGKHSYSDIKFVNSYSKGSKGDKLWRRVDPKLKKRSLSNTFNSKLKKTGKSPMSQFYRAVSR